MRRAAVWTGVLLALVVAPSAQADLTLTKTAEAVVVVGDDGPNRLQVRDGENTGPENNYAFAFYSESGEPVDLGDSGCVSVAGGVETIYCGTDDFDDAVFLLGGGDDFLGGYGEPQVQVLGSLGVDFGAGDDDNEGGHFHRIPTAFLGGEGDDTLGGQEGPSSEVEGGPGNDTITGGGALTGETLRGGPGDDSIQGLNGADTIYGDEGGDTLVGGSGGDTIDGGAGQDNVDGDGVPNAFSGNDTIQIADGERDAASCGFGADSVNADALDLLPLNDCESVTRPAGPGPGPGPGPVSDAKVALGKPARVRKNRRVAVKVSCPAAASGRCTGRVAFTVRFKEKGRKRSVSLGRARFTLQPGKSATVARKLSKRLYKRLRKASGRKLTVRATSADAAGKSFTSRRTAALRL